jgi:hypothetical protein
VRKKVGDEDAEVHRTLAVLVAGFAPQQMDDRARVLLVAVPKAASMTRFLARTRPSATLCQKLCRWAAAFGLRALDLGDAAAQQRHEVLAGRAALPLQELFDDGELGQRREHEAAGQRAHERVRAALQALDQRHRLEADEVRYAARAALADGEAAHVADPVCLERDPRGVLIGLAGGSEHFVERVEERAIEAVLAQAASGVHQTARTARRPDPGTSASPRPFPPRCAKARR